MIEDMRRLIIFIMSVTAIVTAEAYEYEYSFRSTPISQALVRISQDHPALKLSFIYDELEDYRVSAEIATDDPISAIRRLVSYNPISVIAIGDNIYVEAMQRGKYKFSGRIVDEDGETVPYATVMFLVPKDSVVVTFGTTDVNGNFYIPCDRSNVVAKVSGVGYLTTYYVNKGFNFGDLVLPTNSIQLKGVTVEASNATLASDRSTYMPTSRQKRNAQDGIDLLRMMAIPEIRVDAFTGAVTDNFGESLPIYINTMKASEQEIEGLRTADVRRVEFLIAPTDPRYHGAQRVVNFIVQEYEYGGYTKVKADERFLAGFTNKTSVNSKFSYKKFTYDLYVGATNQVDRHSGNTTEGVYSLKDNDDVSYTVTRTQELQSARSRQNRYPLTLRATYNTELFQMRNTVGFTHSNRPKSSESGRLTYQPSLDSDYEFTRSYRKRSNSLSYSGDFFVVLQNGFSLDVVPTLSYSRNNDSNDYTSTLSSQVLRIAAEDAWDYRVNATVNKTFGRKHSTILAFNYGAYHNDIEYVGSSDSRSYYDVSFIAGFVGYNYRTKALSLSVDGGIACEWADINGKNRLIHIRSFMRICLMRLIRRTVSVYSGRYQVLLLI